MLATAGDYGSCEMLMKNQAVVALCWALLLNAQQ